MKGIQTRRDTVMQHKDRNQRSKDQEEAREELHQNHTVWEAAKGRPTVENESRVSSSIQRKKSEGLR